MMKLVAVLILAAVLAQHAACTVTPLTYYVKNHDDGMFAWNVSSSQIKGDGYVVHNVYMTSQMWLTPTDSTGPVWTHWVQFCVPDKLDDASLAYLWIDGGRYSCNLVV
tara:strand:+ start:1219 stop:1542 length:324 start_codon:yes stop_codon:yes gene_type:complete